jgi:3-oxoacyl-(acyl-carrier-protein) synthase
MAGFNGLKALSSGQIAPFSLPVGLNIGEAACFWVVEEMEHAMLRNAKLYGKVIGHATSSDAYHPTAPDPRGTGVYHTLQKALEDSGIELKDIGYINTHGTGTEANDRAESKGIAKFIQEKPIPAVSLKSFFGHCMGAAGILETTCSLLSMNENFIPPTVNFSEPRPGCTLDYVPNKCREKEHNAFISANYAFGGNNAAVVVSKWDLKTPTVEEKDHKVVITGVGAVTSLGISMDETIEALKNEKRGIAPIKRFDPGNTDSRMAGLVPDFKSSQIDRRLDLSDMNLISTFAAAAAKLSLDSAGIRPGRANAYDIGIAMGVCNGPSEEAHMTSVITKKNYEADLGCFINITANSTAGWVSNALYLKGPNISLAPGPHAGMQAFAYAYDAVARGEANHILAGASDAITSMGFLKYHIINYLYNGEEERDYRIRFDRDKQKVMGEGAAMLVLENIETATERGADILGEVLGYGMSTDAGEFLKPNLDSDGLKHACTLAVERSGIDPSQIDLVIWAPQGNVQDKKVIDACSQILGNRYESIPMITTTFNTGYIESASSVFTLGCVLYALKKGDGTWPQITGLSGIDERSVSGKPRHLLVAASSDIGYNFATIIKPD